VSLSFSLVIPSGVPLCGTQSRNLLFLLTRTCCSALLGSATAYGSVVALRAANVFGTVEAVPSPSIGCATREFWVKRDKHLDEVEH